MAGIQRIAEIVPSEKEAGWESEEQKRLLVELFKHPLISSAFFFSGGTSLSAMYLGHRKSEDLDLFTNNGTFSVGDAWKQVVAHLHGKYDIELTIACGDAFASGIFVSPGGRRLKVDMVYDCFAVRKERPIVTMDGVDIRVDVYDNIVSGKLSALMSRGAVKDILDTSAIFTHALEKFGDERASDYFKLVLRETAKRDMLAEDIVYIRDMFSKIGQKHKEKFNSRTLAWILAVLDEEIKLMGMDLESDENYDRR